MYCTKSILVLLACFATTQSFTCPENTDTFHHADVSTGCQVYHVCENSILSTLTCAARQAFNAETLKCEDASTFTCTETMQVHHHHKRAIADQVHLINIHDLKAKLVDAFRSIKPMIEEIIRDIAPSVYHKFQLDYLPALRSLKKDVLPFFYEKVYPHVQKWLQYFQRIAGKVVEKAYKSYGLSNSTHIAIVSISDIADEVSNELAPVVRLGRYLSSTLNKQVRHKRSLGDQVHMINIQDLKARLTEAYQSIRPMIEEIARDIAPSVYEKFQLDYLPALRSFRKDVLPFFYEKVYPIIQKWFRFLQNIAGKVVEKAYRSYELSNSTHIALVSLSDIADEVSNELAPVVRLGRYLSSTMMDEEEVQYRRKRSIEEQVHMIDIRALKVKLADAYRSIKPLLEDIVRDIAPSVFEKFQLDYLPALRSVKKDVLPFFYEKVYPHVQKWLRYSRYIAGKVVEKAYRSYELSNSTHIAIVSISDIADEVSNELTPLVRLGRYLSSTLNKQVRHKRSVGDQVHMIDIQQLRGKLVDAYHSIKPMVEEIARDVAPSVFEKFQLDYLPAIRSVKKDIVPFFYAKVYPHIQQWFRYFLGIAGKVVEKAYRSYELSNSTHIAIVSVADIADDVSNELAPIVDLGRYLSSTMMKNNGHIRHKRQASDGPPDFMLELMSPVLNNMMKSFLSTYIGDGNSLISKLILPTLYDILGDAESRFDVMKLYVSAKSAFSPVIWQMMKEQAYNTPEGTIIKVPRHFWDKAVKDFKDESVPILFKLAGKHLQPFFYKLGDNVPLLLQTARNVMLLDTEHEELFKDHLQHFINKHRTLFRNSTRTHVSFYTVREILDDLQPLKVTFMEVVMEYLRLNPNSYLNLLFGEGSFFQRQVMGPPVYAKPRQMTTRIAAPVYPTPRIASFRYTKYQPTYNVFANKLASG